jgi:flagellar biosynthesis/type III secretory pathway protein FliH
VANIDLIYFGESSIRNQQVLAKMKADLAEYALHPKASEAVISYRNDLIARLSLFGEVAENTINTIQEEKEASFSEGFSEGYKTAIEEIKEIPDKYANREQYREYIKLKAIQDFPHLY